MKWLEPYCTTILSQAFKMYDLDLAVHLEMLQEITWQARPLLHITDVLSPHFPGA